MALTTPSVLHLTSRNTLAVSVYDTSPVDLTFMSGILPEELTSQFQISVTESQLKILVVQRSPVEMASVTVPDLRSSNTWRRLWVSWYGGRVKMGLGHRASVDTRLEIAIGHDESDVACMKIYNPSSQLVSFYFAEG